MKSQEQKSEIVIKKIINDHKIGEKFEYNGIMLEVAAWDKDKGCSSCYFYNHVCPNCPEKIRFKLIEQCETKDTEQKSETKVENIDKTFSSQVTNNQSDEEIYSSLLDKLLTTYKFKNTDYGSAFAEMFDELGIDYAYGKLREKINRIKVLRKQPNMVENEGLEDALLDTAGYAILTLVELKKRNNSTT